MPSSLLARFKKKGFVMEPVKANTILNFPDGSSKNYQEAWKMPLPLSFSYWYKGVFYEGSGDYLVLGRRIMKSKVILYTREEIQLLDEYPEDFDKKFPLEEKSGQYYVRLSINDHEHMFYLDTGHSDAITMPVSEKQYSISPVHEIRDELRTNGGVTQIVDLEEEHGCLRIGDITKYGPIVYADYFERESYWFNPAMIFAEFVLDLKGGVIGFR